MYNPISIVFSAFLNSDAVIENFIQFLFFNTEL